MLYSYFRKIEALMPENQQFVSKEGKCFQLDLS